jgi:hypothetical protein
LKALQLAVPTISVQRPPMSVAQVSTARQAYKIRCVLAGIAFGVLFLGAQALSNLSPAWTLAAACVLGVLAILCFPRQVPAGAFMDLHPARRDEFLEECARTPEGQAYREAIGLHGREFLIGELCAMRAWNRYAQTQRLRAALYELSESVSTPLVTMYDRPGFGSRNMDASIARVAVVSQDVSMRARRN